MDAAQAALRDLIDLELLDAQPECLRIVHVPTPRAGSSYAVIPYSNKINYALDRSEADLFVYLDNNSMPSAEKLEVMAKALEEDTSIGAVYCTQKRTGFSTTVAYAQHPVPRAFCILNYTQVMHRKTKERWTTDMKHANPDLADGIFWQQLHGEFGAFQPAGGTLIHDTHHIPFASAVGL